MQLKQQGQFNKKTLKFRFISWKGGGGVPVFVLQIYPNLNCDISAQIFFQLSTLSYQIFQKKNKNIWPIQKLNLT